MKVPKTVLLLVFAGAVFLAMPARAFQASTEQKAAPAAKETKWQGYVVRVDKDNSMITIRGGPPGSTDNRQVIYDTSTVWTKVGKPLEDHDFKQDTFVIFLGSVDTRAYCTRPVLTSGFPSPAADQSIALASCLCGLQGRRGFSFLPKNRRPQRPSEVLRPEPFRAGAGRDAPNTSLIRLPEI